MSFNHHNHRQITCSETSAQFLGRKIIASFKMQTGKLIHIGAILILFVLLTPSAVLSYTVLWDTSHGVYVSGTFGGDGYQPSQNGYYRTLAEHLGNNNFTVDTTSQGFLTDDPGSYDVIVVCLTSAFYSSYTTAEVDRIVDFVNDGGGLLIMGDLLVAPNANIQPVASEFGITLALSDVLPYDILTAGHTDHPIFDGVDEIFMYAAAELSAQSPAFPVAWQEVTEKDIAAVAQYGQGRVVALGDSTLWSWVNIYEERFYTADNPQFAVSTFNYLAVPEPVTLLLLGLGAALLRKKRPRKP
ncbi:MAG: PEP-CTERM sorting domain-containing protein [Planctomycetes bacterium]|nr:PEP-CTERM sorting domain-containing protein [Planctomycetota bacterium]